MHQIWHENKLKKIHSSLSSVDNHNLWNSQIATDVITFPMILVSKFSNIWHCQFNIRNRCRLIWLSPAVFFEQKWSCQFQHSIAVTQTTNFHTYKDNKTFPLHFNFMNICCTYRTSMSMNTYPFMFYLFTDLLMILLQKQKLPSKKYHHLSTRHTVRERWEKLKFWQGLSMKM